MAETFLNHHVLEWRQKWPRPAFMIRSQPYKKDDNAHVEQKNWTHVRQSFGYERYDNPEVVGLMNAMVKGPYGQLLNYFHASLKLDRKEREGGRVRRINGKPQTPFQNQIAPMPTRRRNRPRVLGRLFNCQKSPVISTVHSEFAQLGAPTDNSLPPLRGD